MLTEEKGAGLKAEISSAIGSGLTQNDLEAALFRIVDDSYTVGGPERVKKAAEDAEKARRAKLTPDQIKAEDEAAAAAKKNDEAARKLAKEQADAEAKRVAAAAKAPPRVFP